MRKSAPWLQERLDEGHWPLTREMYDIFAEDGKRWSHRHIPALVAAVLRHRSPAFPRRHINTPFRMQLCDVELIVPRAGGYCTESDRKSSVRRRAPCFITSRSESTAASRKGPPKRGQAA